MSLPWIAISKRLLEAVKLINAIPTETFTQILNKITQNSSDPFTSEDLHAIETQLKLSPDSTQLLLQSIAHVFKKSSRILIKPTNLQKNLTEHLNFDAEKAEQFVNVWTKVTKDDFGDVDKRKKVDNISWEVNLETHSSDTFNENIVPKARLCLEMSDFNSKNAENVTLEMNENELMEMYRTLESIQNNLDVLNIRK